MRLLVAIKINVQLHKGRCSGLIKVLPGYENIYAAHSTYVLGTRYHISLINSINACNSLRLFIIQFAAGTCIQQ